MPPSKIIQITAGNLSIGQAGISVIYALTEDGEIYRFNETSRTWIPLPEIKKKKE